MDASIQVQLEISRRNGGIEQKLEKYERHKVQSHPRVNHLSRSKFYNVNKEIYLIPVLAVSDLDWSRLNRVLAFSLKEQELAEEFGMCFNLSIVLLRLYYMEHPAITQITLHNVS